MSSKKRWILAILFGASVLAGLTYTHHVLGRPDRILAAQLETELKSVRDQIVRYEYETGSQPAELLLLVPCYLREEQIENENGSRYVYDVQARTLRETHGPTITGLFSYQMAARQLTIEKPNKTSPDQSALVPINQTLVTSTPPIQPPQPPQSQQPPQIPLTSDTQTRVEVKPLIKIEVRVFDENKPLELMQATVSDTDGLLTKTPPEGALVFEAEHTCEMNYGWEVHPDKQCSGGAYLHCKEGIANGPGQIREHVGNFYQVRGTQDLTALRYHFHLPVEGKYYIYGRMFTTDTHCSNHICVAVDQGGPSIGGMGNTTPFRFLWCKMEDSPKFLKQGDHFLHAFIHEDGVKIDQFIVSPIPITGDAIYKSNYTPGIGTAFETRAGDPVLLGFDLKNSVITPSMPPDCKLVLRRLRSRMGQAHMRVTLQGAKEAKEGEDLILSHGVLDLGKLPDLCFLPLDFSGLNWETLPRREYLLRAELSNETGLLASAQTVLRRPYSYEIFGPGKFLDIYQPGPLDKGGEPKANDTRTWLPFSDKSWQELGVLDFGLHISNNSQHPVQYQTLYAKTKITVSKAGVYLFKLQSDDQMILWLDEKEIFQQQAITPVTRTANLLKVNLSEGEHRLRMRVNQHQGRWQATLIIRSETDDITPHVIGMP